MSRRTRKSAFRPTRTATISVFPELPGVVFYGEDILDDDIETAKYLQTIRAEYEQDGHAPTLIQELTQFGFPDSQIAEALLNPATITECGYGWMQAASVRLAMSIELIEFDTTDLKLAIAA